MILKIFVLRILPELACTFEFMFSSSQRREIKSVLTAMESNRLKTHWFHRLITFISDLKSQINVSPDPQKKDTVM